MKSLKTILTESSEDAAISEFKQIQKIKTGDWEYKKTMAHCGDLWCTKKCPALALFLCGHAKAKPYFADLQFYAEIYGEPHSPSGNMKFKADYNHALYLWVNGDKYKITKFDPANQTEDLPSQKKMIVAKVKDIMSDINNLIAIVQPENKIN